VIPDVYLSDSFAQAGRTSKFFPKPAHILEAWDKVKVEIPEQQEKPKARQNYLTIEERETIKKVRTEHPQFNELLDALDIERNPNGLPDDGWWIRFNKVLAEGLAVG